MTILEALQWASAKLKKTSITSPMLDAEILLSHVLYLSKTGLFAHGTDTIRSHQLEAFTLLIERRSKYEPVAYLTQTKDFFGRSFEVNRSVLIPRPETELLIETVLPLIREAHREQTLIADIGTGSGAIGITLALETGLPVYAVDISAQAIDIAKKNADRFAVCERMEFRVGNLLEPLQHLFEQLQTTHKRQSILRPFRELMVCANLPYLTTEQWKQTEPDVRLYEPAEALLAGADGLDAYFLFFKQLLHARKQFPSRLVIGLEIDPSQTKRIQHLIRHSFESAVCHVIKDLQKLDRLILIEHV